jgi:hypothetical protein
MACNRPNPKSLEAAFWIAIKKLVSQHLASTRSEEYFIRKLPLLERITLCAWGASLIHAPRLDRVREVSISRQSGPTKRVAQP